MEKLKALAEEEQAEEEHRNPIVLLCFP